MGSPNSDGHTAVLCRHLTNELEKNKAETEYIELHGKKIAPCTGCFHCQSVNGEYGCAQKDDMQSVVESILKADVLVFATPVYTWQVTPPVKAVMDRMFGLNKFFGRGPKAVLNKNQAYALIATCGSEAEVGVSVLDKIFKDWCGHSGIKYLGNYTVSNDHGTASYMSAKDEAGAKEFAKKILKK